MQNNCSTCLRAICFVLPLESYPRGHREYRLERALHSPRVYFNFSGYGGLSVSVQGPSKAELTCKEVKAGLIKVNYKPTEPGVYVVAVKFADNHVKGKNLLFYLLEVIEAVCRQSIHCAVYWKRSRKEA